MTEEILKHPRAELRSAARAIVGMRNAKSLEEFEAEWREFLTCLEKVWTKVERSCQAVRNKFEPWQGKYHRLRKKDMLLRYLKQARDADNHSIQDFTKIEPGSRSIRFVNPQGGYIKHMEIRGGEITAYEGDPIVVEDKPPHPVAVPVKNNGEWFNPPTSHLGQPVTTNHPIVLAELGLRFYEGYVNEVERQFFKANSEGAKP
jgi:hypothetical protein